MKLVAVFLIALVAVQAMEEPIPTWAYDAFEHWSTEWGMLYANPGEREFRAGIFYNNLKYIEETNASQDDYKLGLNGFSALTVEEFKERLGGVPPMDLDRPSNQPAYNLNDVPASVDWLALGAVTPVKNQAACGSCWAFSTVGTLEGTYEIATGTLNSYSEQQIVDCDPKDYGCGGGWPSYALDYTQQYGIELETSYPYAGHNQQCAYDASAAVWANSGQVNLPARDNDALKAGLAVTPVSICLDANGIMSYSSGIYSNPNCGTSIDHCITATGYGAEDGTMYWSCKNSWGSTWGEEGYIRFLREDGVKTAVCCMNCVSQYGTY